MKRIKYFYLFIALTFIFTQCFLISCVSNCKKELGNFYTLKQAYLNGFLTDNDLTVICELYNKAYFESGEYINFPENTLSYKTQRQIKRSYLLHMLKDQTISLDYVNIYAYYGTYNNSIVIGITDSYCVYDILIIPEYKIGNVIFYNYSESYIMTWVK